MTIGLLRGEAVEKITSDGQRTRTPAGGTCCPWRDIVAAQPLPATSYLNLLGPLPCLHPMTSSEAGEKEREPSENIEVTASRILRLLKKKEHGSILENRMAEL